MKTWDIGYNKLVATATRKKNKFLEETRKYWLFYCTVFIFFSFCFFFPFLRKGVSFVHYGDAYNQHLPALEFYSEWLKSALKNIIHLKGVPFYSLSLGYGGDILTTLNYYGIGDPLNLLVIFANKYTIVYFYDGLIILRLFISGIFFSLLLKEKGYKLDAKALCGTLVYCFSGWAIVAPLTHIFFGTILLYLPLLILGSERIINGKPRTVFILGFFFLAISNFYFLYVGSLVTLVYVIVELIANKAGKRKTCICIAKHLSGGIIGLLLSAPILIPVCLAVMNSTRTGQGTNTSVLYVLVQLK